MHKKLNWTLILVHVGNFINIHIEEGCFHFSTYSIRLCSVFLRAKLGALPI